jgi:hypothetical protein
LVVVGPVAWLTCSPDLNILGFFLWGYIKENVHVMEVQDQGDLIICILVAAKAVSGQPRQLVHVRISIEHLCLVEEGTLSRVFGGMCRTLHEESLCDKMFV